MFCISCSVHTSMPVQCLFMRLIELSSPSGRGVQQLSPAAGTGHGQCLWSVSSVSVFSQYDDQYGFDGQKVLGGWLNSIFKGKIGDELRQLQRIQMQDIGAQIAAFDWNVVCAQRLLVALGEQPFGG